MNAVLIDLTSKKNKLTAFGNHINANVVVSHSEEFIAVNNQTAQGLIRCITLNNGLSMIAFRIILSKDIILKIRDSVGTPSHLLYAKKGSFDYCNKSKYNTINKYQNVIIGATNHCENYFLLPKDTELELSIINVEVTKFSSVAMQFESYISHDFEKILAIKDAPYCYFGGYCLKIANDLTKCWTINNSLEEVQNLEIEGHVLLLLSRQLIEYKAHKCKSKNYEYLEESDVETIRELVNFIEENIEENITITTLVKQSGIHAKKLQTGFQLLFNKSINEFIRGIRLKIAVDSLENSNKSISEIVYDIGLNSRSYFSKIFFEHYGILPVDFRKRINENKVN